MAEMMNGGTARLETRPGQLVGLRETKPLRAGYRRDDLGRGWRKGSTAERSWWLNDGLNWLGTTVQRGDGVMVVRIEVMVSKRERRGAVRRRWGMARV
ncbi:hypothetical protein M0R45_026355 [Rubus argutus]|uniref:Uncharacterized protein n=1 Tax=Rubus argutus TaxID=59490 RepID=A0AAW1WZM5_RUBAR